MSFQNQLNHEVKSFYLLELVQKKNRLIHLGSIEPMMSNYDLHAGWFRTKIIGRHTSMEMCSEALPLSSHLSVKVNDISPKDRLSVNAIDANAIATLIGK